MPNGSLYYGPNGFLYKKMGGAGLHRSFPMDIAGSNGPISLNNRIVLGSGVAATMGLSMGNRAAIRRRAMSFGAQGCACGNAGANLTNGRFW